MALLDDIKPKRKPAELTRDTDLVHKRGAKGEKLKTKLLELYQDIEKGFIDQAQRADDQIEYWEGYECKLGGGQSYSGNSQVYVPIIHNAVNARATRFVNQLFPKGGRYVEVVTHDGEEPHAITALLEHYVRKAKLRTEVAFPVCVNGDIEGQYNVYVSWSSVSRHVTWKEKTPLEVETVELEDDEEIEEMVKEIIEDAHPVVEVLPDSDVLILPVTCNSVSEALERGGSVTIIRRWTKAQIRQMIDDGEIDEDDGEALIEEMGSVEQQVEQNRYNPAKQHADAAGIKAKGRVCLGYETWTKLKVDDGQREGYDEKRLCVVKYGSDKIVLSTTLNPYWSDRCPLISAPVKKVAGVAKGVSPVEPCMKMQYAANDAINEGMDSATYSLLPIIMTDPLKNPKTNTMILDLAAVWETSPNDTKFATFPQLYKEAFEIVGACQQQIFQTLSVNTAMIPQSKATGKQNQAQVAQEQQVDILTTSDAVTVLEEEVFTEILTRFAELDAQFRDDEITVKAYGYMGMRAEMEKIPPLQLGRRYSFIWFGVEQARNAAQIQQQIALLNVIKAIPPQMLQGRKLNMVPAVEHAISSAFGPRLAPLIFENIAKQFTYDPELENQILSEGNLWPVSPMDDDAKHMEVHQQAVQEGRDGSGTIKQHIAFHRMAQIVKAQAAMAQQQGGGGLPGSPGGAGPGVAGTPRPGAQPAPPRQIKGPPGMIGAEQMPRAGAVVPPRRA